MSATAVSVGNRLSARQAILALLFAPNGRKDNLEWRWAAPVDGRTRLVKELFLIEHETQSGRSELFAFEFTPGPYGPSSFAITDELRNLISSGFVGTQRLESGRGDRILLAPPGGREAKAVWSKLDPSPRGDIYRIKSKFGAMTYRQLLLYVYRAYPEFTENSLIKDEILEDA